MFMFGIICLMGVFHRGGTLGIMLGLLFPDILLLDDFFAYITYYLVWATTEMDLGRWIGC